MALSRTILVLALALTCTGCIHHLGGAKKPTKGWEKHPADCAVLTDPRPAKPTLRIFACHSFWYGDHAAIWVGSPSGIWTFWDPAGWYADDKKIPSKADVMCQPFDLQTYWRWRSVDYDGLDMMVFEWDITEAAARRLHYLLTSGCYPTDTWAGLCCFNVCSFIERYLPGICSPPFLFAISPGCLGDMLWSQNPDRVIVFHKGCRTKIWYPLQIMTGSFGSEFPRSRRNESGPIRWAPTREATPAPLIVEPTVHTSSIARPAPGTLLRYDEISPAIAR